MYSGNGNEAGYYFRADPCGGRKSGKSMEASANMQGQIVYVNGDGAQIAGGSVINGNTEGNFAGARAQRPQIPDAIPEDVQEVVKNFRMIAGEASGIIKGI